MAEKYLTVKLSLSQIGRDQHGRDVYRSRIEQSPLGASRGAGNDFTLSDEELKAERDFAHALARGKYVGQQIERFGRRLFNYAFGAAGSVLARYNACLGAAAAGEGVMVRLALAVRAEKLIPLPWEYMHDGASYLLNCNHSIVRVIDGLRERQAPFSPIRRILVAVANPSGGKYQRFDAEGHVKSLRKRIEKLPGIEVADWLIPATRNTLEQKLRDENFDTLYFLGHGTFDEVLGGQIILETDPPQQSRAASKRRRAGKDDPLDADLLAEFLANAPDGERVRFVYLNSCSTAETGEENTFTGVAQRLMHDGEVASVVAMQTPVEQTAGLAIAEGFFDEIKRGFSPERALLLARRRSSNSKDSYSWGVPVVYSYVSGPEDFEKNRLAALLSAEVGKSTYGLFLPTFRRGIPTKEYEAVKITHDPPHTYSYKGQSFSRRDTEAVWCVLNLLSRVARHDEIEEYSADEHDRAECSHWFLFGSKSNDMVNSIINRAENSNNFRFEYTREQWTLHDRKHPEHTYTIDDPSQMSSGTYAMTKDYGAIEKIVDEESGRVFFLFSGLGDRATHGCGWYFMHHWEELLGQLNEEKEFGIILSFPQGLGFNVADRIDRATGKRVVRPKPAPKS